MEHSVSNTSSQPHIQFDLPRQYVTFRVGALFFGVDVAQAKEIIRYQAMTPVPLAPAFVRGLINLRGQIITAIDLRVLLQLTDTPPDGHPMNVVVQTGGETVSLLVDRVGDVIDIEQSWYEPTPETIPLHVRTLIRGVFKLKKELLLVLDGLACVERGVQEDCNV